MVLPFCLPQLPSFVGTPVCTAETELMVLEVNDKARTVELEEEVVDLELAPWAVRQGPLWQPSPQ